MQVYTRFPSRTVDPTEDNYLLTRILTEIQDLRQELIDFREDFNIERQIRIRREREQVQDFIIYTDKDIEEEFV